MKEPKWKTATEEEVWKFVGWHLAKNGIETVLVGGAVAAIYSDGIYKSGDLDFVVQIISDIQISFFESVRLFFRTYPGRIALVVISVIVVFTIFDAFAR